MTNLIYIDGQIGQDFFGFGLTLSQIESQYDKAADSIEVHINSVGGDVREGFAIHDSLVSQGKPITTVVVGKCYSIATIILLSGEKRLMQPNAEIMIHNPWGHIEGTAEEIQKYADWVQKQEDQILDFYIEKTGAKKSDIRKMMDEQTFMNFAEAKKNGFATGQVEEMKAVAIYNPKNMKEFTPEQKQELTGFFAEVKNAIESVKAMFKHAPKALVLESATGKMFVDSDSDEMIGKSIFSPNDKGEKSENPVADGDVILSDGRTVKVKAGKITEIVADDKVQKLEAELATAKAEAEAEKQKATAALSDVAKIKTEFEGVQAKFTDLQSKVLGSAPPEKPAKERTTKSVGDPLVLNFQEMQKEWQGR